MTITIQELLKAGYKQHPQGKGQYCVGLYQKAILEFGATGKKLYFINLYHWQFPGADERWSAEVRLYKSERDSFDVNFMIQDHSIREIENFYELAYTRLYCIPDVHNN
jgi:hypothetical protein